MRLTYKYRLKPSKLQQRQLEEMLELCRYVYNQTLATRKNAYQQHGETLNYYDTAKLLPLWKQSKPELKHVYSQVLQNVQIRVELAFQAFFRRVSHGEAAVGYPRFKGCGWYDSFTYPQYGNGGVVLNERMLRLSKVGEVKVVLHRPIAGEIKTVTIQRQAGKWYACFSVEADAQPLPLSNEVVGIDLGLKTFAVLSNGEQIKRQRWMKQDAHDIARLQRKKERLPKSSKARKKALLALNHAYQRATNRRNDFAHQHSRKLVNRYGVLVFEDLNIQDMQAKGNKLINRNIADAAWGTFVQYTAYKAENAGRGLLRVNPRGTTQSCSGCGKLVAKDLTVRIHDCPYCGLKMDRDLNAALNILTRGMASMGNGSP